MFCNQENTSKENKQQLYGKFEETAWKHLKTIWKHQAEF